MDNETFEAAMKTIRGHADKNYVFENGRKPIVFVHAKKENENVNELILEINEHCGDRLDIIIINEYDLVQVGEKAPEVEEDDLALDL